jgi:protoporphyrinogen oxidase
MEIAIIGGGFTGLSAAYRLTKAGHSVTVFEKEETLGGLAYGFKKKSWKWYIEGAYHHLFTNDRSIIGLIKELGLSQKLIIKRPITSTMWNNAFYQLDSPVNLFTFPGLSLFDKIRTAILLGFLKLFPFWRLLERFRAEQLLIAIGGKNAWKTLWEPLMYGKFHTYAPSIAASWFWARIVKRTPSLCYIDGGFHTLVEALGSRITAQGGKVRTGTPVEKIVPTKNGTIEVTWNQKKQTFDRILITVPTPLALRIMPGLSGDYTKGLTDIPHVHAQVLIVETTTPILKNIYWLNVNDRNFPFLAAVCHTNFMDKAQYGGKHLTYFGNYLPQGHPFLALSKRQLLEKFMPAIKRIAGNGASVRITDSFLFVGPFAQPVHERSYSTRIPPIKTPLANVFLANMDFVVPWDRGTNYAVELGFDAANAMLLQH